MHEGLWNRCMHPGAKGRTIGLVGFGGIGKEIAKRANAMDMHVLYYCRHPKPEWEGLYGASYRPLEELLAECDYVSANIPLTKQTEKILRRERICTDEGRQLFHQYCQKSCGRQ